MKEYKLWLHVEEHDTETDEYVDDYSPRQIGPTFESGGEARTYADSIETKESSRT